ncbi:MAG: sugar ABC transporter permease, partial [Anaerolineae bacterium]|nr:sugar ABC transporter permease [Anaerolineae bacterium]
GLLASLIIVILVAGPPQYGNAISDLLAGRSFLNTLLRTFVYTLTGTLLAIGLGTIAALLVKDRFPGRNIVRGFMLFPYVAPIVSVVFIWKLILNAQFGLVNELIDAAGGQRVDFLAQSSTAFLMIVLFQGWRYFPFAFLFILARIQAIPDDMYEAAKVDGAAPSQRLLYITLPQLQAVFGTLFVLRFIWTFNKFDDVFLLTGGAANTQLVTIEIFDQLFSRSNIGTASAVAVVLALVLMVVVGIYFRWFLVEEN